MSSNLYLLSHQVKVSEAVEDSVVLSLVVHMASVSIINSFVAGCLTWSD